MQALDRAAIGAQIAEDHLAIQTGLHDALAASGRAERANLRWIRKADSAELWRRHGHRHMAAYVSAEAHVSHFKARRWIAAAHALEHLPRTAAALEAGALSLDKVVELSRFITPQDERRWITWARKTTAGGVRDRADHEVKRSQTEAAEHQRDRSVTWWSDEEHTHIHAVLAGEDGARVTKAIDALADNLPDPEHPTAETASIDTPSIDRRRADALALLVTGDVAPKHTTVWIHAPIEALVADQGSASIAGAPLHPETVRRLLCDCNIRTVVDHRNGSILTNIDVGRVTRSVSKSLREMVLERDGHRCTFPGCGLARYLDVHHVVHWVRGGETAYYNLMTLCHSHHKLVHEHGWSVVLSADGKTSTWFRPGGREYDPSPKPPAELPTEPKDPPRLAESLSYSRLLGLAAVF